MIDSTEALSPGWWVNRLLRKLGDRRPELDLLDAYYKGNAAVPVNSSKAVREAYQRLMAMARTNFAELVVEAVRERMKPVTFRTGAEGDDNGDGEAWRIWQANSLDADCALVHRASLVMRDAYVIVGAFDDELGAPLITPEDPREIITEHDPVHKRKVVAALKAFRDDASGMDRAYLYLPGQVFKASRKSQNNAELTYDAGAWGWDDDGMPSPGPVADLVPVVRFPNRADLAGNSTGEFEPHLALLDRINYTILNRLEIATMQAFRQRGLKGNFPQNDPTTGEAVNYNDIFESDPGALWLLPETAEVWESGQVDLNPIRQAIRDDVQDLAAVTRTPLFYLTPDATNGSAEGASLAREGLVFKTWDRIAQAGEAWERVMALAFRVMKDEERGRAADMEVGWADPQRFSLAERYDAASKAQAAGVPWRYVMADVLQFSPQQIARMEADKAAEQLQAAVFAPPTVAAAPFVQNGNGRAAVTNA